ncbi:hypothetical protein [Caballeronia sp. SBC2]|uniref:hypothetical protein n=1 Tax=Caballeronia sp. SBC2 TaxID=2705547 RepID=UPI0013E1309F|nr:hypothetical protein [Caballeronia sp. SBC2]QIE22586.1 hypothetical protein SBC2_05960 [Caballeronia sp. SBC2]
MGQSKRLYEDDQRRGMSALDICIEAGAVQRCEIHEHICFDGRQPKSAAYDLAKKTWYKGEKHGFDSLPNLMEAIDEAYNQNSESKCAQCASNAARD